MPALGFLALVPAEHFYVSYKVGDEYRTNPIAFFAVYEKNNVQEFPERLEVVPMAWHSAEQRWVDARLIQGFTGILRTYTFDAHYLASESDMTEALQKMPHTERDIEGWIGTETVSLLSKLIAAKRVRSVLASRLPPPLPEPQE